MKFDSFITVIFFNWALSLSIRNKLSFFYVEYLHKLEKKKKSLFHAGNYESSWELKNIGGNKIFFWKEWDLDTWASGMFRFWRPRTRSCTLCSRRRRLSPLQTRNRKTRCRTLSITLAPLRSSPMPAENLIHVLLVSSHLEDIFCFCWFLHEFELTLIRAIVQSLQVSWRFKSIQIILLVAPLRQCFIRIYYISFLISEWAYLIWIKIDRQSGMIRRGVVK
jgi:hypothetical protein